MAKSKKSNAKSKDFKEFSYAGDKFDYSGRIYPGDEGRHFMYLTLNEVITIQCHFVEGKKVNFISFPSWQNKDKEWKSYVYWDEAMKEDMDELLEAIDNALND